MSKYIYWNYNLEIRMFPNNNINIMNVKKNNNKDIESPIMKLNYEINDSALKIISLIDGTRTLENIISILSERYKEDKKDIEYKLMNFIENVSKTYGLKINEQTTNIKKNINILKSDTIYPIVASIELTNKCNLKCLHCYGDYDNTKDYHMEVEKVKELLNDLKKVGVRIIELTGGEITVYPFLKEVLLYAVKLNFDQISLLSNGYALSDEIKEIIINNKENLVVQIDLHGMTDRYLNWFTKVPNTLNTIRNNIIKLAENDVSMRVVTVVTEKNMNHIEKIAEWVYSLGVKSYGISPVIKLGRAINPEQGLYLDSIEHYVELEQTLNDINVKYPGFLSLIENGRTKELNCGCLASHVVISSNGDIKLCTMDNKDYFNSVLGNVFNKNIKNIYDDNRDYIFAIYNISSPKLDKIECIKCEHKEFCSNCILRGFSKAKELKEECNWYKHTVSNIIKEELLI